MIEFAASAKLGAVLGSTAGPMIGRAAGSVLGKRLGKLLDERNARERAEEACAAAFDEWLVALFKSFEECGLSEQDLKAILPDYMLSLETFIEDDSVSAQLLRPFTERRPDPELNGKLLIQRWNDLKLPSLPENFNAEMACRWYVEELNRKRVAIDVLRPLWQAQADERRNTLLEDIRGRWAAWDLDQYADAMRQIYQALDITTLELPGRSDPDAEPIKLRDIFIPQHARRSRPHRILPRDYLTKLREVGYDVVEAVVERTSSSDDVDLETHWEKTPREPIFDIFSSDSVEHLVILGDPGAGKSCLGRYITLSLLEGLGEERKERVSAQPWLEPLAGYLPLLIELRRFVTWQKDTKEGGEFLGYLHHLGRNRGFGLNEANLDRYLRDAPSIVIYDGLDEVVDPKKREDVAEAITGFARTYAPARVVVTSRIAGFDQRPFMRRAQGFTIVTLDDLDREQIEQFSNVWFTLTLRSDPEQAAARHRHLVRSVAERPQLRTLAGNPLLLTVIALIARRQELPAARPALYSHALQIFCHQWDFEDKKLELPEDSPLKDLELDDKLAILRRVAWSMLEGQGLLRANTIERDELRSIIKLYFAAEWWPHDEQMCRSAARDMIQVLEHRNYILCQQGGGLFGFIHRTFLEYLCSAEILWRLEKERSITIEGAVARYILPNCEDDSWSEIICLLAAQLQIRDVALLIESLVQRPVTRWRQRSPRSLVLGVACLGERRQRDHHSLASLFEQVESVARQDRDGNVRADVTSALARQVVVPRVRALLIELTSRDVSMAVRYAAAAALSSVAADAEVFALLIKEASAGDSPMRFIAVEALGQAGSDQALRVLLIERASDDDPAVRSAAVRALGEAASANDAEVRVLLVERASDNDPSVRAAAVRALRRASASDAEVRRLLVERASDNDPSVRSAAVGALGRASPRDAEVGALLIEWASDNDQSVRSAAIGALGSGARASDVEVWKLLIAGASDNDWEVRFTAVGALGRAASTGDAEVRALLIDRASNDDESPVRWASIQALGPASARDAEVRDLLIKQASDDDMSIRSAAVETLGEAARDAEVRALLIERASDDDPEVRSAVIRALGETARDAEIRALLIERASDDDPEVRSAAVRVLGEAASASDAEIRGLLIEGASDNDPSVRAAAVGALGRVSASDAEVRRLLVERASDNDPSVRAAAVGTLGDAASANDAEVRELLIARAGDDDGSVRSAAVQGWFRGFGHLAAGVLLSRDYDAVAPWLDPHVPIDEKRVQTAARRLSKTEADVRQAYERLAQELPLRLPWKHAA